MKCPLLTLGAYANDIEKEYMPQDCLGEKCAWWDDTLKLCSVKVIAQFMVGIGVHIHNIAENMSFKAQP